MENHSQANCIYRLDSSYRITYLDPNWSLFAKKNGATGLEPARIIGTPIWNYIADDETKCLYYFILGRLEALGSQFRFPIRCDGPKTRRFMEISVTYRPQETFEFSSNLLRSEDREYQRLLEVEETPCDGSITCCGWCKKCALPGNLWVEVEDAVNTLGLFTLEMMPKVTHGVCPDCKSSILADLAALE